jgi:hypothetical protein
LILTANAVPSITRRTPKPQNPKTPRVFTKIEDGTTSSAFSSGRVREEVQGTVTIQM